MHIGMFSSRLMIRLLVILRKTIPCLKVIVKLCEKECGLLKQINCCKGVTDATIGIMGTSSG